MATQAASSAETGGASATEGGNVATIVTSGASATSGASGTSPAKSSNIAGRLKSLLSSFIHPTDGGSDASSAAPVTDSVKKSSVSSATVTSLLPKSSTRHEAFIRRVEGYTTLTWFGKPVQLSPVRCARYGWENTSTDVLRCVTCRELLYCRLPSPADVDDYNKEVLNLEQKLVQSHRINCSWRVNPCQGLCLGEIVPDRQTALDQFIVRLMSLKSVPELPQVNLGFLNDPALVIDSLRQVLKESSVSGILGLKDKVGSAACLIALCGWTIKTEGQEILTCTYCCRKVGFWKYVQKKRSSSTENVSAKPTVTSSDVSDSEQTEEHRNKRRRVELTSQGDKFDPVSEHQYWCAWLLPPHVEETQDENATKLVKKSDSQNDGNESSEKTDEDEKTVSKPSVMAGWKWYLYTLLPNLNPESVRTSQRLIGDIKTTPPHEGLRSIRHLLKDWVSSEDIKLDLDKSISPQKSTSP